MSVATLPDWARSLDPTPELPTRRSPVKWVVLVDRNLPAGLQVNAAACLGAAMARGVPGLVGAGGPDASGDDHPGLPWLGCTVLAATGPVLRALREEARAEPELVVTDMADVAQRVRVYADYLAELARTDGADLNYLALGLAGPRAAVDRLTGRFPLLR
ncbi:DUF2000 domain-containing protein [Actinomadura kijaniata]|uniref:DUF2000 domain-containing protein n=1 Tax=Actinomadura kijaniata TaxID=46161 RepID=UPI003F1D3C34